MMTKFKIIYGCLFVSGFVSIVAAIAIAVVTPNLRPALDTNHAMKMIQSLDDLQKLQEIAASQTEKLENTCESYERLTDFACVVLFTSASCSAICLYRLWRIKPS